MSLVYRVSSNTARATQRNPVLKNQTKQRKLEQEAADKEIRLLRCIASEVAIHDLFAPILLACWEAGIRAKVYSTVKPFTVGDEMAQWSRTLVVQGDGGPRLKSLYLGGRDKRISEFKASLVYTVSSRTARAIQRNPVLEKQNKQKTNKKLGDYICL